MLEEVVYTSNINGQARGNSLSVIVHSRVRNAMDKFDVLARADFQGGIFRTYDPRTIKALDEYEGYGRTYCRADEAPRTIEEVGKFRPGADFETPSDFVQPPPEVVLKENLEGRAKAAMGETVSAPVAPGENREAEPPMKKQVTVPPPVEEPTLKPLDKMNLGELRRVAKSIGLKIGVGAGITKEFILDKIKEEQSKSQS